MAVLLRRTADAGGLDRDKGISWQRSGGLYAEEERYGVWALPPTTFLCELKTEWLLDDVALGPFLTFAIKVLILINCQDFMLIANRGSVGNSPQSLLTGFKILEDIQGQSPR